MEAVIELTDVSVNYKILDVHQRALKTYFLETVGKKKMPAVHDIWALRDVSFAVDRGDVLGIIGHNGAGKSTLLRVICGILEPTSGRVAVRGDITPIIDMQAGFSSDLTGLENIYLGASIFGLSRKAVEARLDDIIEFSGLEEFIETPIRAYSTGMRARLGFAVATQVRPDILVIDEALAVGDKEFRAKCMTRIREYKKNGTCIVVVSHGVTELRELCTRVLWLEHGRVREFGPALQVLDKY